MRDIAAGLCIGLATVITAQAAAIVAASPQGEVAQVRQVQVRFSQAVVAFGDPRLADPFALACQGAVPTGAGRWVSDRIWLYDFRDPLPPGTRCTAKLRPEWKPSVAASGAASAAPLTGLSEFAFSTGGPAIVSMQPGDGAEIEEDQHFLIRLNGPAIEASVLANARCEVEGIGERLPLVLLGGEQRAQLLKARRIPQAQWPRLLIARCERPLANGAALRLVWGKGIAAAANPQVVTTIEQRFRLQVRAAFTAEFSCEREKAAAPCLSIRPMTLRFSAPVLRVQAAQVRLAPASGDALAPVFDKDDKAVEVTEIAFPKPLAENAAYSIVLPRDLKDNAGRPLANATSFPLQVATGAAPPIAKFATAPFGIVER
ncbi:MAG: Ig-like domain-containing protein, partial [Caldimonas sp.]